MHACRSTLEDPTLVALSSLKRFAASAALSTGTDVEPLAETLRQVLARATPGAWRVALRQTESGMDVTSLSSDLFSLLQEAGNGAKRDALSDRYGELVGRAVDQRFLRRAQSLRPTGRIR